MATDIMARVRRCSRCRWVMAFLAVAVIGAMVHARGAWAADMPTNALPNVEIYAYGYERLWRTDNSAPALGWMSGGFWIRGLATRYPGNLALRSELRHDLALGTTRVKYAYMQWSWDDFTLAGGQFLDPAQYPYPSAEQLVVIRWPAAQARLPVHAQGARLTYSGGFATMEVAVSSDPDRRYVTARIAAGGVTALYAEFVGVGAVAEYGVAKPLRVSGGFSRYLDREFVCWLGGGVDLSDGITLDGFIDFGDVRGATVLTVNYWFAPKSAVRFGYDSRSELFELGISASLHHVLGTPDSAGLR